MRTVIVALIVALTLALGVLEVVASRASHAEHPEWYGHPDAFSIWHAR
ncbi:MAG TPA: hypothetical protein VIE36_19090 [Methylomirabilota bacterium]|jgi:hypothetical protein